LIQKTDKYKNRGLKIYKIRRYKIIREDLKIVRERERERERERKI